MHHRAPRNARLDFERHPLWFMRALLRATAIDETGLLVFEVDMAVDWLIATRPEPDATRSARDGAGSWKSGAPGRRRELALAATWPAPVAGMPWGACRVVAIDSAAALAAEAAAMKNCLATYEEACRAGEVVVYSIRERSTGARIACFAAERDGDTWELLDVAGKMNAHVDEETARIGHAMVAKLNGGRGGEVAPF